VKSYERRATDGNPVALEPTRADSAKGGAEPLAYFILSGAATIGLLAVAMSRVWLTVTGRQPRAEAR
jgi:hypothetical protein